MAQELTKGELRRHRKIAGHSFKQEKSYSKALEGKKAKKLPYAHKEYTGPGSAGSGVFASKKVKGGYEEYLEV